MLRRCCPSATPLPRSSSAITSRSSRASRASSGRSAVPAAPPSGNDRLSGVSSSSTTTSQRPRPSLGLAPPEDHHISSHTGIIRRPPCSQQPHIQDHELRLTTGVLIRMCNCIARLRTCSDLVRKRPAVWRFAMASFIAHLSRRGDWPSGHWRCCHRYC